MHRTPAERFEDQEIECALEEGQRIRVVGHSAFPVSAKGNDIHWLDTVKAMGRADVNNIPTLLDVRAPTLGLGERVEFGLSLDGCEPTSDGQTSGSAFVGRDSSWRKTIPREPFPST